MTTQKPHWFDPWHPFTCHQSFLVFSLNIVHHT